MTTYFDKAEEGTEVEENYCICISCIWIIGIGLICAYVQVRLQFLKVDSLDPVCCVTLEGHCM